MIQPLFNVEPDDARQMQEEAMRDDGLRECDVCGKMKPKDEVRGIYFPPVGDTTVCDDCLE
jgi:hypothetical protein